jgi:hypothetical protein
LAEASCKPSPDRRVDRCYRHPRDQNSGNFKALRLSVPVASCWMHVENLGQSGSDSKVGIVNQIRVTNLDTVVTIFQRYSAQFIGSDWQVGFD